MTATPHLGQEMSPRVVNPADRTRQLARAVRYRIAAIIFGVAILATVSVIVFRTRPENGNDWVSVITGTVCGLAVFCVLPWLTAVRLRRKAGERMYLNGTQLTIAGSGGKPATTLDLSRTRAEVRLDWLLDSDLINATGVDDEKRERAIRLVRQGIEKEIAHGNAPCVYAPVLILHRDDGRRIPVLLADDKTRQMRSVAELHALERAMQFASDSAIQRAAGQLRTIARWRRLPAIFDAPPDAIPETPVDHPATADMVPTPVLRGESAPEITVTGPIKP